MSYMKAKRSCVDNIYVLKITGGKEDLCRKLIIRCGVMVSGLRSPCFMSVSVSGMDDSFWWFLNFI